MAIDAAVLASAKQKAAAVVLGQQALNTWASVQRDILVTATDAETRLAAGSQHAAVIADAVRRQGAAIVSLMAKVSAKSVEIKAALALPAFGGFTSSEVEQPMELITALATAMRDTALDGSGLPSLIATIKTAITSTGTTW